VLVREEPIPDNYGIHDTFVRDGVAMVSAWNSGLLLYDVGHGIRGGSPASPVFIAGLAPGAGPSGWAGAIHNAWWFHNEVTGEKRYVFLGQEGPGFVGAESRGDIYVVEVADLTQPRHVATFRLPGSGPHNFWVDESAQILYAAHYNGGVAAIDVSGTLSGDISSRLLANVRPGGSADTYVWGVQLHRGSLFAIDMESGLWELAPASGGALATRSGGFNVPDRWSSDLWLHGDYAYTGTWGGIPRNDNVGNALKVWSLRTGLSAPIDSIVLPDVSNVSDVEVSEDGKLLLLTTEGGSHGLYLYSLANPASPAAVAFFPVTTGLHTGTFADIGGRRYVFAAKNPASPAMMVFDVTDAVP